MQCGVFQQDARSVAEAGTMDSSKEITDVTLKQDKDETGSEQLRLWIKPNFRWSKEAMKNLVQTWGKVFAEIREEKYGQKASFGPEGYERVCKVLCELGHSVTVRQCKYKIRNLTAVFKKVSHYSFLSVQSTPII